MRSKSFADLKQKFTSLTREDSLQSENSESTSIAEENDNAVQVLEEKSKALQEELGKREEELSRLARMHKLQQKEASALIKELESELTLFNTKLNAMCAEKPSLDLQVENKGLQDQVEMLETAAKEMDKEFSALVNGNDKVEDGFVSEVSKIKNLMVQVNQLKQNVDCLSTQKADDGAVSHENLFGQVNKMRDDLGSMGKKNADLEWTIKKQSRENSELLLEIDSLKKEFESKTQRMQTENVELKQEMERLQEKTVNLENTVKERENKADIVEDDNKPEQTVSLMSENEFETKLDKKNEEISNLTSKKKVLERRVSELESDMKMKLEDQISSHESDIRQLMDEKESLQAKILELEITLTEKEDEIASLQRRNQLGEDETSARVSELASQINYFQEALSAERKNSLEKSTQLENQEAILKQQEDTINKLREDSKLVKRRILQAADRKMDEVTGEFRNNFEDKLRMLSQRIKVAEQLHAEDKDNLKKIKQRCKHEHPDIERKLAELTSPVSNGDFLKLSQAVDEMMKQMEHVVIDFDSREGSFLQRLSRVRLTIDEIKPLKNEPSRPSGSPFIDGKEHERVMKETIIELEEKVNKEEEEIHELQSKITELERTVAEKNEGLSRLENEKVEAKLNKEKAEMSDLQSKIAELEKTVAEKDEGLSRLGNEKVEAIRQLCMWIEYRQSRFDDLKEIVLVKKATNRGKS